MKNGLAQQGQEPSRKDAELQRVKKERGCMGLFIALIIIVTVIEICLNLIWDRWYFQFGIPVFQRHYQGSIISFPVVSSDKIEALVQDKQYVDIVFKYAQDNFFLFKDKDG